MSNFWALTRGLVSGWSTETNGFNLFITGSLSLSSSSISISFMFFFLWVVNDYCLSMSRLLKSKGISSLFLCVYGVFFSFRALSESLDVLLVKIESCLNFYPLIGFKFHWEYCDVSSLITDIPVGFAIMVRGGLISSIAFLRMLIGVTSLLELGAALSYDALFLFDVDESLLFLEKSLLP